MTKLSEFKLINNTEIDTKKKKKSLNEMSIWLKKNFQNPYLVFFTLLTSSFLPFIQNCQ